jgi:hypothetical protein
LKFGVEHHLYRGWQLGQVRAEGGFSLTGPKGTLTLENFSIVHFPTGTNDNLFVRLGPSNNDMLAFDLSHIKVRFARKDGTMTFGYADAILRPEAAKLLGVPKLAGTIIGMVTVHSTSGFLSGDKVDEPIVPRGNIADDGGNGNVKLHTLGVCQSFGRIGTFPTTGISGLGMSTTSCNVTTVTGDYVDWYQQMDERHPVIPQNFYRIQTITGAGTRFEQIGEGWVKHGFLSTNSFDCGSCVSPPVGGNGLGVNCSDTYGASLNASRSWLGPRNEINPFTGWWECTGSYFSNYQPDCISRFNTTGLNAVDHRLQVYDEDLPYTGSPYVGSTYIYEACYISHDDLDRYNNAAWRLCSPAWGGSSWSFPSGTNQTQGVAIDKWGQIQPAPRSQPQTDGDILVAVEVTPMAAGMYHYEYAVYNHTSDRQMRMFAVPIPDGATVQNIGYHDVDKLVANDWAGVVANNAIVWKTSTFAQDPNANSLKWGTTKNFRFDCNVAPVNATLTNGLFKPGSLMTLSNASKVPANPFALPTAVTVGPGAILVGNVNDLLLSDDNSLNMRPGVVLTSNQSPLRMVVDGTTSNISPASLKFRVEARSSVAGLVQTIELWNYQSNSYDLLNTSATATTDSTVDVTAATPGNYLGGNGATRTLRSRVSYRQTAPVLSYPWLVDVDQAAWIVS